MGKDPLFGRMEVPILGNFLMVIFMDLELMIGGMEKNMSANLVMERWKVEVNLHGQIEENILENGKMVKEAVMGQMGEGSATDTYTNLESVTATNPYKSAMYTVHGRNYEVLYYYTDLVRKKRLNIHLPGIEKASPILDEELTPVVLQNHRVVGWGRAFLKTLLKGQ